jgi:NO-binding membrane sensor protein with MHYT domain
MFGTYDLRLVALSYLVAVFASYTALDALFLCSVIGDGR